MCFPCKTSGSTIFKQHLEAEGQLEKPPSFVEVQLLKRADLIRPAWKLALGPELLKAGPSNVKICCQEFRRRSSNPSFLCAGFLRSVLSTLPLFDNQLCLVVLFNRCTWTAKLWPAGMNRNLYFPWRFAFYSTFAGRWLWLLISLNSYSRYTMHKILRLCFKLLMSNYANFVLSRKPSCFTAGILRIKSLSRLTGSQIIV